MAASTPPSAFDRIFNDVRKDLPSVPDAVLKQVLFRVMDDFTQHTNIWQEGTGVAVQPTVVSYPLVVSHGKPNRLLFVYDNAQPNGWAMSGLMMRIPGTLTLSRSPTTAASWTAILAKRTYELDAVTGYPVIDDWLVEKYADTLGQGILARLQIMPQKPWSNPMLAQPAQRAYISGRSEARINDAHANIFNAQNWMYPQGWATVTRKPWT